MALTRDEQAELRDILKERRPPAPPPPSGPTPEERAAFQQRMDQANERQQQRFETIYRLWWAIRLEGERMYAERCPVEGIRHYSGSYSLLREMEIEIPTETHRRIEAEVKAEFAASQVTGPAPIVATVQAEAPTATAEVPMLPKGKSWKEAAA